jgi:hypothetical protein
MPVELYVAVGAIFLVIVAFVWLRRASKKRSDDPKIGETDERGWWNL